MYRGRWWWSVLGLPSDVARYVEGLVMDGAAEVGIFKVECMARASSSSSSESESTTAPCLDVL